MDINGKLQAIGLTPDNSIVIGSGILNALKLRESKDIDLVVTQTVYDRLKQDNRFTTKPIYGREILIDEFLEIGTSWFLLSNNHTFDDLRQQSIVIDSVRYITAEFLLDAKKSWLQDDDVRQKDFDDVELIEKYLKEQK